MDVIKVAAERAVTAGAMLAILPLIPDPSPVSYTSSDEVVPAMCCLWRGSLLPCDDTDKVWPAASSFPSPFPLTSQSCFGFPPEVPGGQDTSHYLPPWQVFFGRFVNTDSSMPLVVTYIPSVWLVSPWRLSARLGPRDPLSFSPREL